MNELNYELSTETTFLAQRGTFLLDRPELALLGGYGIAGDPIRRFAFGLELVFVIVAEAFSLAETGALFSVRFGSLFPALKLILGDVITRPGFPGVIKPRLLRIGTRFRRRCGRRCGRCIDAKVVLMVERIAMRHCLNYCCRLCSNKFEANG